MSKIKRGWSTKEIICWEDEQGDYASIQSQGQAQDSWIKWLSHVSENSVQWKGGIVGKLRVHIRLLSGMIKQ